MGKKVQISNSSIISSSTIESRLKWHPSTTPTLKKRFIDFSLLKKTLEKLYLKSKEELVPDEAETKSLYEKRCEISSPPSLSHWSDGKWNPLTPTLRNIDFKQLRKTIEKLYMTSNKPVESPVSVPVADRMPTYPNDQNDESKIEKSLKF